MSRSRVARVGLCVRKGHMALRATTMRIFTRSPRVLPRRRQLPSALKEKEEDERTRRGEESLVSARGLEKRRRIVHAALIHVRSSRAPAHPSVYVRRRGGTSHPLREGWHLAEAARWYISARRLGPSASSLSSRGSIPARGRRAACRTSPPGQSTSRILRASSRRPSRDSRRD